VERELIGGNWEDPMKTGMYLDRIGQRLVSCDGDDSIEIVARLLTKYHIGAMTVLEADGRMVGIISEHDIIRGFSD
jgi:CBS domain-containing protein